MLCKLCNINKANQTGSHIIPSFLLTRIFNDEGEKGRDKALGFTFDANDTIPFFERSVLTEKIDRILGLISEEEIELQIGCHPLKKDNIFCSKCEKKFMVLETEYSKTLEYFKETEIYKNKVSHIISFLFWISIVWRSSVERVGNFSLKKNEETLLNKILNTHAKDHITLFNEESFKNDPVCLNLSYRLLRSVNYHKKSPSTILLGPYNRQPYYLMVDEYVLAFYFKKTHVDRANETFFGFENIR
jgi:hypothetical protein